MKKLLIRLVKKWILNYIDELQDTLPGIVNKKVDLPGLNEEEERKLFIATIDATAEIIKEKIRNI